MRGQWGQTGGAIGQPWEASPGHRGLLYEQLQLRDQGMVSCRGGGCVTLRREGDSMWGPCL